MSKNAILNSLLLIISVFMIAIVYNCKYSIEESDYFKPQVLATHFNGEQFVGSTTCMECHKDIYSTHLKTAHYNTSAIADSNSVKGSFKEGSNTLDLRDVAFEMKIHEDSLYQHTTLKNRNAIKPPSKFDIVIGSGVKGQSFLTWENNELYQLQVSYYTPLDDWVNSPSFPAYSYTRPIGDACLKCHVTFATNIPNTNKKNIYDRERMLYGIDCERCHRPSEKHVVYHRANPEAKEAKHILKIKDLSRQQRLDVCAQCHSGLREELIKGTPFSFLAGDRLNEYSRNHGTANPNEELDVHGNQYGLLTSSECFKQTPTMDCNTCHDPHKNQRGNTALFNSKCIACHSASSSVCTAESIKKDIMGDNCIACHMPTKASQAMQVQLAQDSVETSFNVRTHLIKIYSEEEWQE